MATTYPPMPRGWDDMNMNRGSEYRPDWAMKLGGPVATKKSMKKKRKDMSVVMKGGKGGKGK